VIGFVIVVGVIFIAILLSAAETNEDEARLRKGVQRYPGTRVRGRSPFRERRIDLPGPPCPARIRWWIHNRGRRYTEFAAKLSYGKRKLRVATLGWASGSKAGPRFQTGDSGFDAAYDVSTSYPDWAANFLEAPMRQQIQALDRLHSGPFLLDVRGEQVIVRVHAQIEEPEDVDAFIKGCYVLAGQALGLVVGVQVGSMENAGPGECPVCGVEAAEGRVLCRACKTPHHGDCWEYNGGCAVFACGERRHAV